MFPNNLFAKMLGFTGKELFEAKDRDVLEQGQDASKSNVDFS
jgi:hypothetical protein